MASGSTWQLPTPVVAQRMAAAATALLATLSSGQRAVASFPFAGDERYRWRYTPGPRQGLRLKDMTPVQRTAALGLLDAALSLRGARQARDIIALEVILGDIERGTSEEGEDRDPELYYFSVFGDPGGAEPWAWRANGHHLALNFTVAAGAIVAPTPLFFGANPAEVRHGPALGLRTLPEEEDLARSLLAALDPSQKTVAVVDPSAPSDILTKNYRLVDPAAIPRGITFAALAGDQRERLVALVRHYTDRVADELNGAAWRRIEGAGLDAITFAWAGGEARNQPHYYAVKGPTFLIEYDNTQNNVNHIHTVWRDWAHDWGLDVLADHYHADH